MKNSAKLLLACLNGLETPRCPFWFMRQAGRYLPEYRELRSQSRNFLDFCYNPAIASEATLQPIKRFGMDGAIIFSDILVVPHALGVDVRFEEGNGPILEPLRAIESLNALSISDLNGKLAPVYEAVQITASALPDETALIGFVGAPWTLACYMVQGRAGRDFEMVRSLALTQREFFTRLMSILTRAVTQHAINQVKAGAEIIQLFDSWAGGLSEEQFSEWVIAPAIWIVKDIKKACPGVPVIGFPRQAGSKYLDYAKKTGIDAVSIDPSVSLNWAGETLQTVCTVQGNLDPLLLAEDRKAMLARAEKIVAALGRPSAGRNGFVFNLGHGILPHTPVENVQALCDFLKNLSIRS